MEAKPHALLLNFPGTNCQRETSDALELVGFTVQSAPLAALDSDVLVGCQLVVFSGGFSYGDAVMAGRIAQLEIERQWGDALKEFADGGGWLLGICNGFQILLRLGLLPAASLTQNEPAGFQCRWVDLEAGSREHPCVEPLPARFELPIAHGEGRLISSPEMVGKWESHVIMRYVENVNGSEDRIAGICDVTGRILGLMPHPERFIFREQHGDPDWQPEEAWGWGYHFFRSLREEIV